MNTIFELLNEVMIDLDEYEACELSEIEKQNMKMNFKKKLKLNSLSYVTLSGINRKVAAMAAAILIIVLSSAFIGDGVLAGINLIRSSIEEFFHYNINSLKDYKTVINKEVTKNGVTVKLNEVSLDDDQIILSSTFSSDKVKWEPSTMAFFRIYINGNEITGNGGGGTKAELIDDSACSFFIIYRPNDSKFLDLTGNLNIKVVYDKISTNNEYIKGKWSFEFTSNRDILMSNIKIIPINTVMTIGNGQKLTVDNLRISPIFTKLNYTLTDIHNYGLQFIIKDQNGNEIKFVSGQEGSGRDKPQEGNYSGIGSMVYNKLDENVTMLKITPILSAYSYPNESGKVETIYRKELEEETFEIIIN